MPHPIGVDEANCIPERKSTAMVMAPATAKGGWTFHPRGYSRSGLPRSRTIPLHLKSHAPEVPYGAPTYGAPHTTEVQSVTVHQLLYILFSAKVGKLPATLHKCKVRSRLRRRCVLVRESVRDSRIALSEGLCTEVEWEAIQYVR
jgi:hypothetical protein